MQNPNGAGKNAVTTAKARGKKKRSSFTLAAQQPSLIKGRRKSVPDEWEPMGCNVRVDATRAIYQKNEITMPEIHHGIANSAMPIPLNIIMKTWDNVPKLQRYQPSELQVVYHRKTGETESVVKPEPTKPPEIDSLKTLVHTHLAIQSSPASGSIPPAKLPDLKATPVMAVIPTIVDTSTSIIPKTSTATRESRDENQGSPYLVPRNDRMFSTVESQTELISAKTYFQTETKSIECQTEKEFQDRLFPMQNLNSTNDCETCKISTAGGAMLNKSELNQHHYQCSASQTEPLKLSNVSSQSTSIAAQTEEPFDVEPKRNKSITKGVGTETIHLSIATVQTDSEVAECGSQTEIDIETPKICLMCDFKQLQIEEIEENMAELQERFKSMEVEFLTRKDVSTSSRQLFEYHDASTITEELVLLTPRLETVPPNDDGEKYRGLQLENDQLKTTIQTLKIQLNSFQYGLQRLRTAIEKPIVEDSNNVSDATIQEVLAKADNFIMNISNSQNRALKINDHLSVLNTCVSVASGIMNENHK